MESNNSQARIIAGFLLATGMAAAAFVLGVQVKHIGSGRQSISVKGLAEKPVKADTAEWTIGIRVYGATFAATLARLREERPVLDRFLERQGFNKIDLRESDESVDPNMEQEETASGRTRQVQKGFVASQAVVVTAKDLGKFETTNRAALQFEAEGHPVYYSQPLYLVSNLEEVKMSLIGAATQNARKRAEEFAKNGGVKVGPMRSATQGAFYILPPGADVEANEYGGTYDKSTAEKIARVVVTIEYNIDR
jgi:hypothetical protein